LRNVNLRFRSWGAAIRLIWTSKSKAQGFSMAEEDPILTNPPTQEMARHVHDYENFTLLFKRGAIAALISAFVVLWIIH